MQLRIQYFFMAAKVTATQTYVSHQYQVIDAKLTIIYINNEIYRYITKVKNKSKSSNPILLSLN